MKRILLVVGMIVVLAVSVYCAGGKQVEYFTITSTGTTGITFTRSSSELYVVVGSTNAVFINWTSSTTVGSFIMGRFDQTDVVEHTEEIRTSYLSITTSTNPVNVRIQSKSW